MVKISNASYENEIHRVDSPFNKDSKKYNFFRQESPNFGERTAGKCRENDQNQGNLLLCKLGSGLF